jgi:type III restriction enzyme
LDEIVLLKARAAVLWCQHASTVSEKPWEYLLIPHDEITANSTLTNVVQRYKMP